MAVIKRVLCPQRLRRVPRQFSWIDHRLVRDRHIVGRSAEALALYLFLVTVADGAGLSYYSDPGICQLLPLDGAALARARRELLAAGLIAEPLQMLGTRAAVLLATIHVLLPVAVLPLLAVMLRLDPRLPRAAASLGAGPLLRFWRIWLPLTLPGVAAGGALVFLLAIGFYITPALLGGERDQLIAWFIAQFLNRDVNWGMAAALSVWLLALAGAVLALAGLLAGDALRARR